MGRWRWAIIAMAVGFAALMWFVATGGDREVAREPRALSRAVGTPEDATDAATAPERRTLKEPESLAPFSPDIVAPPREPAPAAPWPDGMQSMSTSGRVLDPSLVPVADALVVLLPDLRTGCRLGMCDAYPPDELDLDLLTTARTDAEGRFELEGPWWPDGGVRGASQSVFPAVLVRAPGFALHMFDCTGFAGGAHDSGDLVLHQLGTELRARFVDPAGTPLAGVGVWFSRTDFRAVAGASNLPYNGPSHFVTESDASGELRVPGLWPVPHELWFRGPDERWYEQDTLALEPGVHDLGTVVLDPDALPRITGRVTDADGAPLQGVSVFIDGLSSWNHPTPAPPGTDDAGVYLRRAEERGVLTDAEGRYTLRDLDADWSGHVIAISALDFEPALLHDVPFDSEAPTVRLLPAASLRVSARAASDGRTLPDAEVRAFRLTGRWRRINGKLDPVVVPLRVEGDRVLQAGPYGTRLHVDAPGFAQRVVEVDGVSPGTLRDVTVELHPATTVRVRVVDDRGEPVPEASVSCEPPEEWGFAARRVDLGYGLEGMTDADGVSLHEGLAPGAWTLRVSHPTHWSEQALPFVVGEHDVRLDVTLQRRSGITGRLLGVHGEPVAGASIEFTHGDPEHVDQDTQVLTDVEGRFAVSLLFAGDVRVRAPRVPEELVRLAPGERRELVLRQARPFVLEGRVRAGGVPLPDAQIRYESAHVGGAVRSDRDGAYVLEIASFGPVTVSAGPDGGARESVDLEALPGVRARHDFELGAATLAGVVRFPGDEPEWRFTRITLERDGEGVAGAALAPGGGFRFTGLGAGSYGLQLDAPGVQVLRVGPYELGEGERREDLELHPRAGANLRLRVAWQSGQPFEGSVRLRPLDTEGAVRASAIQGGSLLMTRLAPGRWELQVSALDLFEFLAGGADTSALSVREVVTLTDDEERELDVVVPGSPPG